MATGKKQGNGPGGAASQHAKGGAARKPSARRGAPETAALRRKPLRVCMERLLASPPDEEDRARLTALGVPEREQSRAMRLALALLDKACSGDVSAMKEVRDLVGESGVRGGAWQEQITALRRMFSETEGAQIKPAQGAG